mmetsp:Transcript_2072/g.3789  ORF Transcript_2072/g.3789 Transcript_2072/m.3789 type:complete len:297 (-) Transcript_2072:231-1121(-)
MDCLLAASCMHSRQLKLAELEHQLDTQHESNIKLEEGSALTSDYLQQRTTVQLHYMLEHIHRQQQQQQEERDCEVSFEMPFHLEVEKSSLNKDACEVGEGVFLKGKAPKGSVIAVYPGLVALLGEHGSGAIPYMLELEDGQDNPYVLARIDGVLIDASIDISVIDDDDEGTWPMHYQPDSSRGRNTLGSRHNPYALAHKINHGNSKENVNLLQIPYDFKDSFPKHLRPYIPNKLVSRTLFNLQPEPLAWSQVYVALRDICDEELFVDYRINPDVGYPEWYKPVDEEVARRRWAYDG